MPLEWKDGQLRSIEAKRGRAVAYIGIIFHVFYIIFSLVKMKYQNQTQSILGFFLILASCATISAILTAWSFSSELAQIVNNILSFNKKLGITFFTLF